MSYPESYPSTIDDGISPNMAKGRLLELGEVVDEAAARRKAARPKVPPALAIGAAALLGGMVLARRGRPLKTLVSLALLTKVVKPLVPIAINYAVKRLGNPKPR